MFGCPRVCRRIKRATKQQPVILHLQMSVPILERVLRVVPRMLVLTAPAGYGKTTTALEYTNAFKSRAVIDLARLQTERKFLLALLKARSSERADDAYLRQAELSLAADEDVPPQLAERVIDAWRDPGAPVSVVFDNAERLSAKILPLFNLALERCPTQRVCVVCSNAPLTSHALATASPSDAMRVTIDDLALSPDQTRALFADSGISADELCRVIDFARGWPLATLLLRSLHAKGRLSAALERSDQYTDLDQYYEFIQGQIIESLPAAQRRVIEFCASVSDVRVHDVRACLGPRAEEDLLAAARVLPLIHVENNRIEAHPLLRAAIAPKNPHAAQDLRSAAAASLRRGDRDIAAERYIACGDRHEAVMVLDDMLEHGATATVAALAASLDRDVLERHPRWFAITTLLRRYDVPPEQNLAAIQARRERVEQTGDEIARFAVGAFETHQLMHAGLQEQAQERLQSLDAIVAMLKRGGIVNALRAHVAARFVDTLRGALAVAVGDTDVGERLLKRARFTLGQFPLMNLSSAVDGWMGIGFALSDIALIRLHCSRARESLTRSGLDIVLLDLDTNEAFAEWILGDDLTYERLVRGIDVRARTYRTRAFDHVLGCVGLRAECEATGLEPLRRLIIAHLIAAGRMNGQHGLEHARQALRFARELRQPLFITLAAIAVRERDGEPACTPNETLVLASHTEKAFLARMHC